MFERLRKGLNVLLRTEQSVEALIERSAEASTERSANVTNERPVRLHRSPVPEPIE
ncbi:hypothetical protein LR48_Vigan04g096500 [Vigna angularis]|uniref:Uncharacterized protein n=1 Tax=Phaseolus angularis TaxID=3914 RepID=A0A0L9UDZ1_PHAAN|nr:hypothetical protein LR48_Vigan04g096500 [Vigna angularis]